MLKAYTKFIFLNHICMHHPHEFYKENKLCKIAVTVISSVHIQYAKSKAKDLIGPLTSTKSVAEGSIG